MGSADFLSNHNLGITSQVYLVFSNKKLFKISYGNPAKHFCSSRPSDHISNICHRRLLRALDESSLLIPYWKLKLSNASRPFALNPRGFRAVYWLDKIYVLTAGFPPAFLPDRIATRVQDPRTYSPQRSDLRLLAIPASKRQVAASYPNWGRLWWDWLRLTTWRPIVPPIVPRV